MSNEDLILSTLKDIKRELGAQSTQLDLMDEAIRGARDGSTPGMRSEVERAHTRLDIVDTKEPAARSRLAEYGTPAATGTGAAGILYVVLEWFKSSGGS
jgi:hypothetical protein